MTEGPQPPPPDPISEREIAQARLHFHVALAGILIPCLSLPLTWTLAILNMAKRNSHPLHRLWTKRLVALACVDILVCLAIFAYAGFQEELSPVKGPAPLRIGAVFETDPADPTRITHVVSGSPADEAGLRPGDRIDAIDGRPVDSFDQIRGEIQGGALGNERLLTLDRNGGPMDVAVLPARSFALPKAGLFEPRKSIRTFNQTAREWIDLLPPAGMVLFAAIYALIKGARALGTWAAFVLVMGGTYGGVLALTAGATHALGGTSLGLVLLLLSTQMVLLLGLSGLAARLHRNAPRIDHAPPPLSPLKTLGLGVLYFIGGVPRLAVPLFLASTVLFDGAAAPNQPLEQIASAPLGVLGVLLFVAPVVFIGPLAEEVLFRGFLLPRLSAQVSVRWGIWVSAILFGLLHLHYMLLVPVVIYYGLVFGWARMRSGSLLAPVLLHMAVNALASTVYLLR